jgi:hypothetical protein
LNVFAEGATAVAHALRELSFAAGAAGFVFMAFDDAIVRDKAAHGIESATKFGWMQRSWTISAENSPVCRTPRQRARSGLYKMARRAGAMRRQPKPGARPFRKGPMFWLSFSQGRILRERVGDRRLRTLDVILDYPTVD